MVNRSQADINRNTDMQAARRREREYFATNPDYKHLAGRMGTEFLAKQVSKHLEVVIKNRIPTITAIINTSIDELEKELGTIGRPVAGDSGAQLYMVLEMCREFDDVFRDHLDGQRSGGDRITAVFETKLPAALRKLPFDKQLSLQSQNPLPPPHLPLLRWLISTGGVGWCRCEEGGGGGGWVPAPSDSPGAGLQAAHRGRSAAVQGTGGGGGG